MSKMEEFKTITGFENYEVSNFGRVRNKKTGRILKLCKTRRKYIVVSLRKNRCKKTVAVHRIYAIEFIENPNNYPCVNHKDGNKENNHISNLEWCTYLQNNIHALSTGLRINLSGEFHYRSKLTNSDILKIREMLSTGHSCDRISTFFQVTRKAISNIKHRRTWKHI